MEGLPGQLRLMSGYFAASHHPGNDLPVDEDLSESPG
jgi:hypothetical protein